MSRHLQPFAYSAIFYLTWQHLRSRGLLLQGRWSTVSFADLERWSSLSKKAEMIYWRIQGVITVLHTSNWVHWGNQSFSQLLKQIHKKNTTCITYRVHSLPLNEWVVLTGTLVNLCFIPFVSGFDKWELRICICRCENWSPHFENYNFLCQSNWEKL